MKKKRLGEVLTEKGLLSEAEVEEALSTQGESAARLGEILAANGAVSKADLGAALEAINGMAYLERLPAEIDPEVLALIPAGLAARSCALPVALEGKTLIVVMGEPQNLTVLEELEFASGMSIDPRFSFRRDVVEGIKKFYAQQVEDAPSRVATTPAAPKAIPGRMSRAGVAALLLGCGIAAIGTWQAASLVFEAIGRSSDVAEETGTPPKAAPGLSVVEDAIASPPALSFQPEETPHPELESSVRAAIPDNMSLPVTEQSAGREDSEGQGPEPFPAAIDSTPAPRGLGAAIQVGVFRNVGNAQRLADALASRHDQVEMSVSSAGLYVVSVGPFADKNDADRIAGEIRDETGLSPLVRLVSLE